MNTRSLTFFAIFAVASAGVSPADTVTVYTATLNAAGAIGQGGITSTEPNMSGTASFVLTEPAGGGSPTLAYDLRLFGVDFLGVGLPSDDIAAIHIHDTTGLDFSAGTPHVLNIFGAPGVDDDDMVADLTAARVTGLWDDGDLSTGKPYAGNPMMNSDPLSSMLTALESGELFLMVHTTSPNSVPTTNITIGGQIVVVPEPAMAPLLACVVALRRRR